MIHATSLAKKITTVIVESQSRSRCRQSRRSGRTCAGLGKTSGDGTQRPAPRVDGSSDDDRPGQPTRRRIRLRARPKRQTAPEEGDVVLRHRNKTSCEVVLVAAALIVDGRGNVLITRRPKGKRYEDYWEFPGGKVTSRETPEAALSRELNEELCIVVAPEDLEKVAFATDNLPRRGWHIIMLLYCVSSWGGEPRGAEDQSVLWVTADALAQVEFTDMHKELAKVAVGFLQNVRTLKGGVTRQ